MTGSLSAFTPFCGTDSDMVGAAVKVFWGGTQKCSTTPDLARFSRLRFALLRSPTGAFVLPREGGSADGTGVDCSRGANGARYIQPGQLLRAS